MSDLRIPPTNYVIVAGRLTRDPELKYISSGKAVCQMSIANSRFYKDKSGERAEDTSFIDVTCWDKQAEYCGQHLAKGRPIMVEGRLKSESWEDKTSGQKRSKLAIQAQTITPLDWDEKGDKPKSDPKPQATSGDEQMPEDDIPF